MIRPGGEAVETEDRTMLIPEENEAAEDLQPGPREDETLEDLQLGGLVLLQKKNGFRFGMDSVLLADFAGIRKNDVVADFGTGSGVLPLLLAGREKGKRFIAFEIQKEMAEMAERTMKLNGLSDRVTIVNRDAVDACAEMERCSVDAVICNPPYGKAGASLRNPSENRAIARHQEPEGLAGFFRSGFNILKGKGRFAVVYPADRMLELMDMMRDGGLEPKRFRLVYPYADRAARLALVEGVKDAKPGLSTMPPMIIYKEPGVLTNELKSVYHIGGMDQSEQ